MFNLLCILLLAVLGTVFSTERKLEFVQTIFRHGHRAPRALPYPNDSYNESYWPRGWGQLTETGMKELVELGSFFRGRYNGLIFPTFNSSEVFIRSSNVKRAKESAQLMLFGLYDGPVEDKIESSALLKQADQKYAKTVNSLPEVKDDWLTRPMSTNCTNAMKTRKEVIQREALVVEKEFADVFTFVRNHSGNANLSYNLYVSLEGWADIGKEIEQNWIQPDWVNKRWPNHQNMTTLEIGSGLYKRNLFDIIHTGGLYKYYGGFLLNDFLENALLVTKEKQTKRFIAYSSHDVTILNLFPSLGYMTQNIPDYASAVIMEVYSLVIDEKKTYELKLLYRECVNGNPSKCFLKEDNFFNECVYCPVDMIIQRYQNEVHKTEADIHKICEANPPPQFEEAKRVNIVTFN